MQDFFFMKIYMVKGKIIKKNLWPIYFSPKIKNEGKPFTNLIKKKVNFFPKHF